MGNITQILEQSGDEENPSLLTEHDEGPTGVLSTEQEQAFPKPLGRKRGSTSMGRGALGNIPQILEQSGDEENLSLLTEHDEGPEQEQALPKRLGRKRRSTNIGRGAMGNITQILEQSGDEENPSPLIEHDEGPTDVLSTEQEQALPKPLGRKRESTNMGRGAMGNITQILEQSGDEENPSPLTEHDEGPTDVLSTKQEQVLPKPLGRKRGSTRIGCGTMGNITQILKQSGDEENPSPLTEYDEGPTDVLSTEQEQALPKPLGRRKGSTSMGRRAIGSITQILEQSGDEEDPSPLIEYDEGPTDILSIEQEQALPKPLRLKRGSTNMGRGVIGNITQILEQSGDEENPSPLTEYDEGPTDVLSTKQGQTLPKPLGWKRGSTSMGHGAIGNITQILQQSGDEKDPSRLIEYNESLTDIPSTKQGQALPKLPTWKSGSTSMGCGAIGDMAQILEQSGDEEDPSRLIEYNKGLTDVISTKQGQVLPKLPGWKQEYTSIRQAIGPTKPSSMRQGAIDSMAQILEQSGDKEDPSRLVKYDEGLTDVILTKQGQALPKLPGWKSGSTNIGHAIDPNKPSHMRQRAIGDMAQILEQSGNEEEPSPLTEYDEGLTDVLSNKQGQALPKLPGWKSGSASMECGAIGDMAQILEQSGDGKDPSQLIKYDEGLTDVCSTMQRQDLPKLPGWKSGSTNIGHAIDPTKPSHMRQEAIGDMAQILEQSGNEQNPSRLAEYDRGLIDVFSTKQGQVLPKPPGWKSGSTSMEHAIAPTKPSHMRQGVIGAMVQTLEQSGDEEDLSTTTQP